MAKTNKKIKLMAIKPCKVVPIIDGKRIVFDFTLEKEQVVDSNAVNVLINTGLFKEV